MCERVGWSVGGLGEDGEKFTSVSFFLPKTVNLKIRDPGFSQRIYSVKRMSK